ncbi:MAG: hypothetical protein CBC35_05845 [Planctomycetes bacterium TMED75]|nr:hypothetical protein [Planctomycetaceae bacterium]OUU93336.1 MAG: hypothetical protein CBC35_05845 [Planctomycetes bacterium TMED75]
MMSPRSSAVDLLHVLYHSKATASLPQVLRHTAGGWVRLIAQLGSMSQYRPRAGVDHIRHGSIPE